MRSVEWLAGVLEGEGYFGVAGAYRNPVVHLTMTDGDVVEEVIKVYLSLTGRQIKPHRRYLPSGKVGYQSTLTGMAAVKVMCEVLPYMGERRSLKIREVIRAWKPKKYQEAVEFAASLQGDR